MQANPRRILIVAHRADDDLALLDAVAARASESAAEPTLLVPGSPTAFTVSSTGRISAARKPRRNGGGDTGPEQAAGAPISG